MLISRSIMMLQIALFHSVLGLIFYCIYVPLLYRFICHWTVILLLYLSCCKQYCNEHWGACIFLNYGVLQIDAQKWDCWITRQFHFQYCEELPFCFPQWIYPFTFPPLVYEGSPFSASSPAFIVYRLFFFCFAFLLFRATSEAYGRSQARGPIRAVAAGLHHRQSNTRSKPRLRPTPQLTAMLDP